MTTTPANPLLPDLLCLTELVESLPSFDDIPHTLALILRAGRTKESAYGVFPLVGADEPFQSLIVRYPKGHQIADHIHLPCDKRITTQQEVLVIRKGKMKVRFYTSAKEYCGDRTVETGDIIIFISGGHGFEMLEETDIFEVKQGPFQGSIHDKQRFG